MYDTFLKTNLNDNYCMLNKFNFIMLNVKFVLRFMITLYMGTCITHNSHKKFQ